MVQGLRAEGKSSTGAVCSRHRYGRVQQEMECLKRWRYRMGLQNGFYKLGTRVTIAFGTKIKS